MTDMPENQDWKVYRAEWYNDRIMETYISSPIVDKQNDMIPTQVMEDSMDFFMKYGVYSYQHEEMPIGLPLAYKIDEGKVKVRVGIHNRLPMHDSVWEEIKDFGAKGASSIRGETLGQDLVCPDGAASCFNKINDLGLWSVSWVGDNPANVEATVTDVAMAKADQSDSFINGSATMACMAKVSKDCGCGASKEAEEETVKEEETTTEEVEVVKPEDLPDVPEAATKEEEEEEEEKEETEEEVKEDEELTLDKLYEEVKALRAKVEDELAVPREVPESRDPVSASEKSEEEDEVSFETAMKSLKKFGVSVYAGRKATPAPKAPATPKAKTFDWMNVTKSWDELDDMIGGN